MPKKVNGTPEAREQWLTEFFKNWYLAPENKGKKLAVGKANAAFKQEWGSMMRNARAYEIRDQVLVNLGLKAAEPAPKPAPTDEAVTPAVAPVPATVDSQPAPQ